MTGWSGPGAAWSFTKAGKSTSVKLEGKLTIPMNEAVVVAASGGAGIASLGIGGCRRELEDGTLVRLLKDWDRGMLELHALYPAGRGAKPAARAFVEFLRVLMTETT